MTKVLARFHLNLYKIMRSVTALDVVYVKIFANAVSAIRPALARGGGVGVPIRVLTRVRIGPAIRAFIAGFVHM